MKCDNKSLKKGALYCLMCSLILFSQLFMYVLNSPVLNVMTPFHGSIIHVRVLVMLCVFLPVCMLLIAVFRYSA